MQILQTTQNKWLLIRTIAIYCLVALLCMYTVSHFRMWWQGPGITIQTPYAGSQSSYPIIRVRGSVQNLARVYVNGLLVPISLSENTFVTEVALPKGYSTIGIAGYTQSGKRIFQSIPIVYRDGPMIDPRLQFLAPTNIASLLSGNNLAFK